MSKEIGKLLAVLLCKDVLTIDEVCYVLGMDTEDMAEIMKVLKEKDDAED